MMAGYIVEHDGSAWFDFPYSVRYDEGVFGKTLIGVAITLRGAKRIARKDRKKRARGVRVIWSGYYGGPNG